jgi:quinol monooxygenase YgiN
MTQGKTALFVYLETKLGREAEVERFLRDRLPIVQNEPGTLTWYAIKTGSSTFEIFAMFKDDSGRQAHLLGTVAGALNTQTVDLFTKPPRIEKVKVLAAKRESGWRSASAGNIQEASMAGRQRPSSEAVWDRRIPKDARRPGTVTWHEGRDPGR